MPEQSRVQWVDAGRGLAILLVALYHSARWLSEIGVDTAAWQTVNAGLATLRMPVFFTISGMFARKWTTGSWSALLSGKVFFLAWVFVAWEVIGTVFFYLGNLLIGQRLGVLSTLRALLLAPVLPLLELWFIWALAWFFVVARAIAALPGWVQLAASGILSVVALTLWYAQTTGPTGAAKFFFFFLVGQHLREVLHRVANFRVSVAVPVFMLWAVVSTLSAGFGLMAVPGWFFLNCCLGVVAGISLARLGARLRLLRYLGSNTLPVYVAHTPIILAGVATIHLLGLTISGADVVATPLMAAIAVAGALGLRTSAGQGRVALLYGPGASQTAAVSAWLNRQSRTRGGDPGSRHPRPGGLGDDTA